MCGCSTRRAKAFGALMRTSPLGLLANCSPTSIAPCAASTSSRQRAKASAPASVRRNWRVVRCSSCTPISFSSRFTCRLAAEGVMPSRSAAAEKLPSSATRRKVTISGSTLRNELVPTTQ